MEKKPSTVKAQKPGSFVLIDDVPYKVDSVQISKPGKHGSAKAKLTASGVFAQQKKIIVQPADARIDVPIIEKRNCQILSFIGTNTQIMDLEDYSTAEVLLPDELKGQVKEGDEVLVWKYGAYMMIKSKK